MKTYKTIWVGLLIFLLASCSGVKQVTSDKKTLEQKIDSKNFTIYISRCLPTDLVNSTFNTDVVIKLKNDTAYGNLPFHGYIKSVISREMTSGPINFNGPMQDFSMSHDQVKGWNLIFKVKSNEYLYQVDIEISTKGQAVAHVDSPERTSMTYFGEVY
jgi:hypothetical protein